MHLLCYVVAWYVFGFMTCVIAELIHPSEYTPISLRDILLMSFLGPILLVVIFLVSINELMKSHLNRPFKPRDWFKRKPRVHPFFKD